MWECSETSQGRPLDACDVFGQLLGSAVQNKFRPIFMRLLYVSNIGKKGNHLKN